MQDIQLVLDVQPIYLDHLRTGSKTHEGRLARPRYLALQPGTHIKIRADMPSQLESQEASHSAVVEDDSDEEADQESNNEEIEDSSIFVVGKVTQYLSFKEMLVAHGVGAFLPSRDVHDIDGAVKIYRSFPGYAAGERELGVVAIEVKLL